MLGAKQVQRRVATCSRSHSELGTPGSPTGSGLLSAKVQDVCLPSCSESRPSYRQSPNSAAVEKGRVGYFCLTQTSGEERGKGRERAGRRVEPAEEEEERL